MTARPSLESRIVITGVGLTSPNGNRLSDYRRALLQGRSGVTAIQVRHLGQVPAGVCQFDESRYQSSSARRRGTRAGSIAIYCANEAVQDARLDWELFPRDRVGVFLGITEHGNVETEQELSELARYGNDISVWSNYHNPRSIANNPAGEVTINLGITGPHLTLGAACAAGNAGLIQAAQLLRLGEVDLALAGGVSESIQSFGNFASFKSQRALAEHPDPTKASRPFDRNRTGVVIAEGGAICAVERLDDAIRRGAYPYAEIVGYAMNSDAIDLVEPCVARQVECMRLALSRASIHPSEIDIVSSHATGTVRGDAVECQALRTVFGDHASMSINNTKSLIGHTMGAAGTLELVGNIPSFQDQSVHPTINIDQIDPDCDLPQIVKNNSRNVGAVEYILNNSFGMLGINSVVIVRRIPGRPSTSQRG